VLNVNKQTRKLKTENAATSSIVTVFDISRDPARQHANITTWPLSTSVQSESESSSVELVSTVRLRRRRRFARTLALGFGVAVARFFAPRRLFPTLETALGCQKHFKNVLFIMRKSLSIPHNNYNIN